MANNTFQSITCDDGVHSANLQVPTLATNIDVIFNAAGNVLTDQSPALSVTSVKSTTTTGVVQFTGMTTGQTRVKTVRDANDTILELGGSYSPGGAWDFSGSTFTIPALFHGPNSTNFELPPTSGNICGTMWAKTSVTTLSSWTTAATIIGAANTGVGTLTIPANSLAVGDTIRIMLRGVYSHTSTATTFTLSMTLGGTQVFTTGAVATASGTVTSLPWYAHMDLVCIATGSSNTILSGCFFQGYDFGGASGSVTPVSINTAVDNAIDIKMACGANSSSNIMSCVIARISKE
jgi:hypothetical protein